MLGVANHGLNALMEATKMSERAAMESDNLTAMFEESIDDEIVGCLMDDDEGAGDDSVESDMSGNGIGDDEEMEKLLEKIPPSDETLEDDLDALTESCLPEDIHSI